MGDRVGAPESGAPAECVMLHGTEGRVSRRAGEDFRGSGPAEPKSRVPTSGLAAHGECGSDNTFFR